VKCRLCEREAEDGFCRYHREAKANLEGAYQYWVEAYGTLGRQDYLRRVARNPETGVWAAEVARMMLTEST
jgi:hypothetical protein